MPHKNEARIIALLRKHLKENSVGRRLCKKYGEGEDFIDRIPISFEPLDVSAKTINGEIKLNSGLLDEDFRDNFRYIIHEFVHTLQQETGDVSDGADGDYLDDPHEIEAFWYQLKTMENMYSPSEVDEYIDGLMDHHDMRGKDRRDKIKELTTDKEPEKPAEQKKE